MMESKPSHIKYRKIDQPKWKKGDRPGVDHGSSEDSVEHLCERFPELLNESEFQIFTKLFPAAILETILEETYRYAKQKNDHKFDMKGVLNRNLSCKMVFLIMSPVQHPL